MEEKQAQFERLYDTYVDAIFNYLGYRLGNRERAIELTQEVFMKVWQHINSDKPIEYEKAFLYIIAKRLFINEIRVPERTFSLDAMTEDTSFEIPDHTDKTEASAETTELWQAVATLSPPVQELLRLRYHDGLSVGEIATIFEAKENTISMRISRAIAELQKIYAGKIEPHHEQ
jgi:RNA polymerase sigma-70 factor (ECF subfamily)